MNLLKLFSMQLYYFLYYAIFLVGDYSKILFLVIILIH